MRWIWKRADESDSDPGINICLLIIPLVLAQIVKGDSYKSSPLVLWGYAVCIVFCIVLLLRCSSYTWKIASLFLLLGCSVPLLGLLIDYSTVHITGCQGAFLKA